MVKTRIAITERATLTLEHGVKLRFEPGAGIDVERGKLVSRGTLSSAVTLSSNAKAPAPGDWDGIYFGKDSEVGSSLEYTVVEYAGKAGLRYGAVTLEAENAPKSVSIVRSTFRHNEGGVHSQSVGSTFLRFEHNILSGNKYSLDIAAENLSSIGTGNKLGDPIHTGGTVSKSQAWPKVDVPFVVSSSILVGGQTEPAVLTLPEGAVLRFATGLGLHVGVDEGGGLVAKGVTFQSQNSPGKANDWEGIVLLERAVQVSLENCVLEHTGHDSSWGAGGLVFSGAQTSHVQVTGTLFRNSGRPAFVGLEGNCGTFGDPKSGNRSEGQPLCVRP